MINLDEVSKQVNMKIINRIEEVHNYKITSLQGVNDQRWQTYVVDKTKKTGRKIIKATTKEKLYQKLAGYYGISEDPSGSTMSDIFKEWIPFKRSITNSENTIYRHVNHWRRYCENKSIVNKPMKDINVIQLDSWANSMIKDNDMTRKEWQNIKTVISGIWEYSYRSGIISTNPWLSIKISVRFKQISKKSPETQVFIGDDMNKLILKCSELYETTNNSAYIAIIFNLYCGLRVGELVALKVGDINFEQAYMHIEREEVQIRTRHEDDSISYKWEIENHTKTYTSRYVPLIPKAIDILKNLITSNGDYFSNDRFLFVKNGNRLNTGQIGGALYYACKQAEIQQKSTHKIRKTFASKLDAGGVPIDEIRTLLGHTDAQTTLGYIFNPLPKNETLNMIQNSF